MCEQYNSIERLVVVTPICGCKSAPQGAFGMIKFLGTERLQLLLILLSFLAYIVEKRFLYYLACHSVDLVFVFM